MTAPPAQTSLYRIQANVVIDNFINDPASFQFTADRDPPQVRWSKLTKIYQLLGLGWTLPQQDRVMAVVQALATRMRWGPANMDFHHRSVKLLMDTKQWHETIAYVTGLFKAAREELEPFERRLGPRVGLVLSRERQAERDEMNALNQVSCNFVTPRPKRPKLTRSGPLTMRQIEEAIVISDDEDEFVEETQRREDSDDELDMTIV